MSKQISIYMIYVGVLTLSEVFDVLRVALQELLRPPANHTYTSSHEYIKYYIQSTKGTSQRPSRLLIALSTMNA